MIDWTDAFDNSGYVAGADKLLSAWKAKAEAFRNESIVEYRPRFDLAYGDAERNKLDLFLPKGDVKGLVVFIHGGYWHSLDKTVWSHFAQGSLRQGWAFAVPGYTLAPQAKISEITVEIAKAIEFAAAQIDGPIRLVGHSAGGHLVSRMMCDPSPLGDDVSRRIEKTISVSGLHDLRPICLSGMNDVLKMDELEAASESPALLIPRKDASITFWVGASERPELIRQTRLIAETWWRQGAQVSDVYEPGKNHFNVIESLADGEASLMRELLSKI